MTYQTQREGPEGCKDDVQSWVSGAVGSDQKQSAKGQVVLVVEREKPFNLGLEVVRGLRDMEVEMMGGGYMPHRPVSLQLQSRARNQHLRSRVGSA